MNSGKQITLVTDPRCLDHDTGGGEHPDVPERLQVIRERLDSGCLADQVRMIATRPASRAELMLFHSESWLFRFEEAVLSGRTYIDHPDNQIGYESYQAAILSAGAGLIAIERIEGRNTHAGEVIFCAIRPPGHHAEPTRPFGFCFFNNCVIAARYWQKHYGRRRICVFDFDAHHGNGIQTAFEEDAEVFYVSIHEHPSCSYPGTGWAEERGLGQGRGTLLNIPLLPRSQDDQVLDALDRDVFPALEAFGPEAMVVAAGFDGHLADDMSGLAYSTELYGRIGRSLSAWSESFCSGRLVSILEGGYHLPVLGECVQAYLAGLAGLVF
jgi:acetoin utilization deacetylase AcuC-like enzyme